MKSRIIILSGICLLLNFMVFGQGKTNESYKQIKIGTQVWMAENLNAGTYRDGTAILKASSDQDWENALDGEKPIWCYYDYNPAMENIYGKLYNWYAVNDKRGICPEGWHIPSVDEWQILIDFLGGDNIAGAKLKESGTSHWDSPNSSATNKSGFSALPGGGKDTRNARFDDPAKSYGMWWTSTAKGGEVRGSDGSDLSSAWYFSLTAYQNNINKFENSKGASYSVRCMKD
jgi:uncharacterized protein (TIGR02145 family)